jgi:hypothetical protein
MRDPTNLPDGAAGASAHFYRDLRAFDEFAAVLDPARYAPAPEDWWVLCADVRGSTAAIEAGRYKQVNSVGVAVIVALSNALPEWELPFVFGGDGATALVPPEGEVGARRAAAAAVRMARDAFDLELRAGLLPVRRLLADGRSLRVGRLRLSPHAALAMFDGGGVAHAETLLKGPEGEAYRIAAAPEPEPELFEGFECRWQPLAARRGLVAALLVVAREGEPEGRRRVYAEVLEAVAAANGSRPVRPDALRLDAGSGAFDDEARVRSGAPRGARHRLARWRARVEAWVGRRSFARRRPVAGFDGPGYLAALLEQSDDRKFDDALRLVLDLAAADRDALVARLDDLRARRRLAYGIHCADSALMTCFVRRRRDVHLHFVDGADGGYARAARMLKAQLVEDSAGDPAHGPASRPEHQP